MSELEENYISTRVDEQILWYGKRANINKLLNNISKTLIILISASIPLISGIDFPQAKEKNILLGSLGAIISILSGLGGLFKFQEKWTEYRTTSEELKHEKNLFKNLVSPYDDKEKDAFKQLVARVESMISKEHSDWKGFFEKKT